MKMYKRDTDITLKGPEFSILLKLNLQNFRLGVHKILRMLTVIFVVATKEVKEMRKSKHFITEIN
jgi:hypothetical protein